MNYFSILCLIWAAIGIGSRVMMGIMGERWNEWEENSAYAAKRPKIISVVGITGYLLIILTWYMVFVTEVKLGWIMAVLASLTVIKISTLLFNYPAFREFLSKTLNDKKKMMRLNISVIAFSIVLVLMSIFLY